jgi:tripartite-type tricarboxylate transporter receptor subunit TctC
MRSPLATLVALGIACCMASSPLAQETRGFPSRPITIVVQAVAGGGNDALARLLGQQMQKHLGQPVVVENRGGAGGAVGAEYVAKSAPDGYTLLLITTGETYYKALNPSVRFDTVTAFSPVAMIASVPLALIASASQPFNSFTEFVEEVELRDCRRRYASSFRRRAPGPGRRS